MARDRNTIAKRQREVEKKRKADEKRERRAKKKQVAGDEYQPDSPHDSLSPPEHAVLGVFRKYLMTPGKMLCFNRADLTTFDAPLKALCNQGLLVKKSFQGGYALTESGFDVMNDNE